MAVQNLQAEFNTFVRGLITEAGPLTFPENASLAEQNFVLNVDGTRDRRLGMDYEDDFQLVEPLYTSTYEEGQPYSTFNWENVGGNSALEFIVVQVGESLMFFDSAAKPLSSGLLYTYQFSFDVSSVDMTSVDGLLVVARNSRNILIFEYDEDTQTINSRTEPLKVRDSFGVEDLYLGDDLLKDENLKIRPSSNVRISDTHLYNLRNQSWGRARVPFQSDSGKIFGISIPSFDVTSDDPIEAFRQYTTPRSGTIPSWGKKYPANGDNVTRGLIDDTEETPPVNKFSPGELGPTPLFNSNVPRGFFIIDALRRGPSREEQYQKMMNSSEGRLELDLLGSLPEDTTPGGPTCVTEYGGRVWFAGFSGEVIGGDSRSPRLSSYLLFSQLVTDASKATLCYQSNDPTFEEEVDPLDTDGGYVKLNGAYGIKKLVEVGDTLMVFAENGVWSVSGGAEGFKATNYVVNKITDRGCLSRSSVLVVEDSVMYWSESGIFSIARNEFGDYRPTSLTTNTIQSFYTGLSFEQLRNSYGVYDSYDLKARWLIRDVEIGAPITELVFDIRLQAFYLSVLRNSALSPTILAPVISPPYQISEDESQVLSDEDEVFYNADEVVIPRRRIRDARREVLYVTMTSSAPCQITFSSYKDENYEDWASSFLGGLDAEAFFLTGYTPAGENLSRKQVNYLTVFMRRTEDGLEQDGLDLVPRNASSCLVQAQWNWTDSEKSNRWGKEKQMYRYKRFYMPANEADGYDTGDSLIITKNKLRGQGKTLSLLFKTEPGKDCRIVGWGMNLGVAR